MNYLTEIKLFYDWLETRDSSASAIALWHALMQIASRSGWQQDLRVPLSALMLRSKLSRTTIYKEREFLRSSGLINYKIREGRGSGIYRIYSLESRLVSDVVSASRTQESTQSELESAVMSATRTQLGNIYKLNYTEINKEKYPKETFLNFTESQERKSCAKKKEPKSAVDVEAVLAGIEPPWAELMRSWLEYKRVRRESYRSEIGVAKCLSLLRHLAGDDPKTAAAIIDQSIANNWAGLFELKRSGYGARGQSGQPPQPATGQHIGQIKQPDSEERTRKLLEKFNQK